MFKKKIYKLKSQFNTLNSYSKLENVIIIKKSKNAFNKKEIVKCNDNTKYNIIKEENKRIKNEGLFYLFKQKFNFKIIKRVINFIKIKNIN